jgi:selenocysteine-specific elongation factor
VDPASDEGRRRRVAYYLEYEAPAGGSAADISRGTLLEGPAVAECLAHLIDRGAVLRLAPDDFIHGRAYGSYRAEALARVERAVGAGKGLTMRVNDLRQGLNWPAVLWNRIEEDLRQEGVVTRRGDMLVLETAVGSLEGEDRNLADRIMALYRETGFRSPRPDELAERLDAPAEAVERVLEHLVTTEQLLQLSKNVVLGYDWIRKAQELVVAEIAEKGVLNSADFKYRIDSSRKYALAILDYFDARRVTLRHGNERKLAPGYERNLL